MKLLFKGKTKDVYAQDDGNYLLKFKDDVTGEDGVFDPGANTVGLAIAGAGKAGLRLSEFFFQLLERKGIPTHFVKADPEALAMTVRPATPFGQGLEVICRYRAVGSFYRRYGQYLQEGAPLDALVEMTLKDDARQDPLITQETLEMLGILSGDEYRILTALTRKISAMIRAELAQKGLELYDLKLEFGRVGTEGSIALIDEISGGNMRVFRNGAPVNPLDLSRLIAGVD